MSSHASGDPASNLPSLFASLRAQQSPQPQSSSAFIDMKHNATSAPSRMLSSAQAPSAQMSNPLLNLLKFGTNVSSPYPTPQQPAATPARPDYGSPNTHSVHGRDISASDLVASFGSSKSAAPTPREKAPVSASTNHQDALLRLLNQTSARTDGAQQKLSGSTETKSNTISEDLASTSLDGQHPSTADAKGSVSGRNESPIRFFGSNKHSTPTPFEPQVSPRPESMQNRGMFTYVNPFEQLAASSPRNTKARISPHGDLSKRKIKSPSPAAAHASARRKLTPSGGEVLQSIESPAPGRLDDGRSQVEALMGIGAPTRDAETVAEALNEVGDRVDRQVESALAEAEEKAGEEESIPYIKREDGNEKAFANIEEHAHHLAADVKKELDKPENQGVLEDTMPQLVAEAVKEVIDEAAQGDRTGERESAGDETIAKKDTDRAIIPVYQFPMRPFVSIDLIQKEPADLPIREDSVVNIARFKKDFDQADRTLATATNEFIVYGMPKNGGIRIIQQDNGTSSLIFGKTQDRIFNVAISTGRSGSSLVGTQTLLGTGVSGTVYWTTILKPGEELSQDDMEQHGLIIPPISSQSDPTSGGQLKTRAKKSNRNPEFFAIGRGKFIHIIFSSHARSSDLVTKEGLMDTEKYYTDRNLKITTGKAGKDFTFSEDDSMIASLDKAGWLRLWDIRDLIDESNAAASLLTPMEVKTPILTFSTAHSKEKSWPTSVLFADKLRPYIKGTALRYIIVGMKQNHTLQLWDLCLGKAVQELSFPHGSETDAICSITYHPASGIIAVGHPTRNSIYFIHLSAPKYNLPSMAQAKFVQRLANKDSTLPKAEATAIMSGMREYSFADKGQLRSVELVPSSGEPTRTAEDEEDPMLFELYVLHSKGVTCLGIKKEDLGWSMESRVVHPVDAEKDGHIIIKDLREPSIAPTSEPSTVSMNGDASVPATPAKAKKASKETTRADRTISDAGQTAPNTAEKIDKKKGKRNGASESVLRPTTTTTSSESYATAAQRATTPTPQPAPRASKDSARPSIAEHASREVPEAAAASTQDRPAHPLANGDSVNIGISGDFLDKELKKIEVGVSNEFNKALGRELDALYRRFAEDKRVQDAAGAAKQDAMLRLVSSTLSENVEKSLSRIIQKNIHDSVVPSITNTTSATVNNVLSNVVVKQVNDIIPNVMKQALPEAINRTMQTPNIMRSVSDQITKQMTGHIEEEFATALHNSIVPTFTNLATNVAQKISGETERRVREQLQQVDFQRREDSIKIDQLANLVRGLSETVHTMAAAQSDFQVEILKLQQKASEEGQALARRHSPTPSESASMHMTPEQEELEAMATSMQEGRFEEATVVVCTEFPKQWHQHTNCHQWLQSNQQVALFDNLFVRCNPSYLRNASPLVVLSVGAAVTAALGTHVMERLAWLETVFHSINPDVSICLVQQFSTVS